MTSETASNEMRTSELVREASSSSEDQIDISGLDEDSASRAFIYPRPWLRFIISQYMTTVS